MSLIKQHLYEREEEEQALYECLIEYLEENQELFQQLSKPLGEVMGYEE